MRPTYTIEGYLYLSADYIETNYKLNSQTLNFCHMSLPHIGPKMCATVLEFLKGGEIDKKICCLTLDTISENDTMVRILKIKLTHEDNGLVGKYFLVRCYARPLEYIVQDIMKVSRDTLQKIEENIKYVKDSEIRKIAFMKCIAKCGSLIDS
ncbi:unnamed protein product [Lupinus luteus]|uniref:Uncharacterized protein n=1 Tax=Lupinus luteus TaxID=3873 RepID=A0AAV1XI94_LUPLU